MRPSETRISCRDVCINRLFAIVYDVAPAVPCLETRKDLEWLCVARLPRKLTGEAAYTRAPDLDNIPKTQRGNRCACSSAVHG